MKEILVVIAVLKQLQLKAWLILIGVSIVPYFFTHMILPSIGVFFLVLFYMVKDMLSYKVGLFVISLIATFIGISLYLWKPILLLAIGSALAIVHFGIRDKLAVVDALRNELIFIFSVFVIFIALLIGILMDKVKVVESSSDSYIAAIAICIGAILYTAYSFYQVYKHYKIAKAKSL